MSYDCLRVVEHNTITIEDREIQYYRTGNGPNLVLLPGTLGNTQIFCRVKNELSRHYTIYVFDHILVKKPHIAIEVLHKAFKKVIGKKFHIFGTSVGGYLAQYYTEKYPEQINSLIISNSFCDNSELRKKNLMPYYLSRLIPLSILKKIMLAPLLNSIENREDRRVQKEYYESIIDSIGKKNLRQRLNWSLSKNKQPQIDKQIPIFIITVKNDPVISQLTYDQLKKYYQNAKVIELDSGGHFPYLLNPDEFVKTLINLKEFI